MAAYLHDPEAILDYTVDWAAWLGTDTIASVTWTLPTIPEGGVGIVKESQANTTTTATIWISAQAGTAGSVYTVECKITTAGGRTDERSFTVRVVER